MSAIVTDDLKNRISNFIFEDSSATYYIGIGKADTYDSSDTVTVPIRSNKDEQEARSNLMSIKKVDNITFTIPRFNWTSGSIYDAWSDATVGIPTNSNYVLTEDNEVYICIQQGKSATGTANQSVVKPSFTDAGVQETDIFQTADGYRWKLSFALSAARANQFLTSAFIPIENVKGIAGPNAFQAQQQAIEASCDSGAIVGVELLDGGSGYTGSTTSVKFRGDGTSASATATISGGSIVKVEMDDSDSITNAVTGGGGRNYTYASAVVSGNAQMRPILSSKTGLGSEPLKDLKATSIMFNVKLDGAENGSFTTNNDFRQITLLRNLTQKSNGDRLDGTSYKVGRFIDMNGAVAGISADDTITDDTTGVSAHVVEVDSDGSGNTRFRFIQNSNHVIGSFLPGNTINTNTGTIGSDSDGYVDIYSGELLYLENRTRVERSLIQSEDIKIILTV